MAIESNLVNHHSSSPKRQRNISINSNNQHNGYSNNIIYNNNINNNDIQQKCMMIKSDFPTNIKTNFLNTTEVTFCNLSDDEYDDDDGDDDSNNLSMESLPKIRRKRLISTDTDADSIISSVHPQINKKKPNIPDGGYGWMVVLSSLLISLIQDGISFSFGLIYSELLVDFKESKSKTAWVGSLFMAVPLLAGPIMSNLVDTYGCRKMTMVGGVLSCVGFVLASISPSIEWLYLTFGILAGLGLGIGYVTAVVAVAFWFEKKRTFATSIGASGTGIGTFIYAPFTQYLLETYGWRGTTLILGGTLFNMCVCGALMRDPDWLIEENQLESRSQSVQTISNSSICFDEIKKLLETGAKKEDVLDTLVTNVNTEVNQQISAPINADTGKKYQSHIILPTYLDDREYMTNNVMRYGSRRSLRPLEFRKIYQNNDTFMSTETETENEKASTDRSRLCTIASVETLDESEKRSSNDDVSLGLTATIGSNESIDEGYITSNRNRSGMHGSRYSLDETLMLKQERTNEENNCRSFRGTSLDVVYENEIFNPVVTTTAKTVPCSDVVVSIPTKKVSNKKPANFHDHLKRNPSLRYSNYLRNMRVHRNSIHYRGAMLNTHRYRLRASSCPNIYRNSMTTIAREDSGKWYDNFVDIIKSIFDFTLFTEFKFLMMSLSTLILFIWFIVPYFYIKEHLMFHNYSEDDCANLIAVIGVFNTGGMIFLGWIGDQPWLNVTKTYAVCLIFCGLSVALMPIATHSYTLLVLLCGLFGITFASTFSFTPIILVRLVDLDDFTCAYGLILLVQGIGNLVGPPLAGIIYDLTLRWDDAFVAAGLFIAISGVLAYCIGILEPDSSDEEEEDEI